DYYCQSADSSGHRRVF
nr:immunoglobulin light chain junction region [Macaca mulatta]MOW57727.1 immunoglobulin light chain junction region [Macaca mulatta]MOW57814.1 immunoglobulin light chain junction region [Macaca mulatta]MOW57989.1 immunoglobulin light chain junction region [Macaca mulatta]MOW58176.1 immunoglobulin light chain junction region [Macaca mulatta]